MQNVKSQTYSVFEALEKVLLKKVNMAVYRLPGDKNTTLIVQKKQALRELTDLSRIPSTGGFLIAPFITEVPSKTYLIEPELRFCNILSDKQFRSLDDIQPAFRNGVAKMNLKETPKEDFISQVEETIKQNYFITKRWQ